MKSNNKIVMIQMANTASCLNMMPNAMGLSKSPVLAVINASAVIKKTIIKFIGLDLLKKLVIINCFCIFAW